MVNTNRQIRFFYHISSEKMRSCLNVETMISCQNFREVGFKSNDHLVSVIMTPHLLNIQPVRNTSKIFALKGFLKNNLEKNANIKIGFCVKFVSFQVILFFPPKSS